VTQIKKKLDVFKDDTKAITSMNDSNKSILSKHLHFEIKSIKDYYDTTVSSITKTALNNTTITKRK